MAFNREKYYKASLDIAAGGLAVSGVGLIAYTAYMLTEPIKEIRRKHKCRKMIKQLEKQEKELIVAENIGLRNENEKLLRKNQELFNQIQKTEEA